MFASRYVRKGRKGRSCRTWLRTENEIASSVLDTAFKMHTRLGPGLLEKAIVELKSLEALAPAHAKQLLTQLRLSGKHLGLLINFGEVHLKQERDRVVNELVDCPLRPSRPLREA